MDIVCLPTVHCPTASWSTTGYRIEQWHQSFNSIWFESHLVSHCVETDNQLDPRRLNIHNISTRSHTIGLKTVEKAGILILPIFEMSNVLSGWYNGVFLCYSKHISACEMGTSGFEVVSNKLCRTSIVVSGIKYVIHGTTMFYLVIGSIEWSLSLSFLHCLQIRPKPT